MERLTELEYKLEEYVFDIFSEAGKCYHNGEYPQAVREFACCRVWYNYLDNQRMLQLMDRFIDEIPIENEEKNSLRRIGQEKGEFLLNLALGGRKFIEKTLKERG